MKRLAKRSAESQPGTATGRCLCGKVEVEIAVPAFWAWHDHSCGTRRAHGAAYATYVGCWKSRVRVTRGEKRLTRFTDPASGDTRAFCACCGTPVLYARGRHPRMVNIPRALFEGRTGREPLYHIAVAESPDWAYRQETLRPLKGYPGVMWTGARRRRRSAAPDMTPAD